MYHICVRDVLYMYQRINKILQICFELKFDPFSVGVYVLNLTAGVTLLSLYIILFCLVLGRSVVFHAAEKGAPRLACADIVPLEGEMSKKYHLDGLKRITDTRR